MLRNLFKRKVEEPAPAPKVEPTLREKPKQKRAKRRDFNKVYPVGGVIEQLIDHNPKRPGTKAHKAFEIYASSLTVGDAMALGVTYRQLDYDVEHGFIRVKK